MAAPQPSSTTDGEDRDVAELTERLLVAVFTDNPEWTDYSAVTRADLRDGCHRFLTRVLELLEGSLRADNVREGSPGEERAFAAEQDDVAASIGRQRAEQGVPLEAMLRTFRLGGRIVWEALLSRDADISPAAVHETGTAMWAVIDGMSSALVTAYRGTELDRVRRDERRRHALIEDLLSGRGHDALFATHAARELNIPASGDYLAVVVDGQAMALQVGAETTLSAKGIRSVWHDRGDSTVGIVAVKQQVQPVIDALRSVVRGRTGVSPTVTGLAEINIAHTLATLALDTTTPESDEILIQLDQRYPEALVLRSPDLARLLVDRALGPILALGARERELLLETLAVWLNERCSAAHAAPRLHCHRNTVINRLQRVATLLGHPLESERSLLELSLALIALPTLDRE